jgi:diguanylate cyclase (GGDEF)-like protein/PAS domain S-box-containing protein
MWLTVLLLAVAVCFFYAIAEQTGFAYRGGRVFHAAVNSILGLVASIAAYALARGQKILLREMHVLSAVYGRVDADRIGLSRAIDQAAEAIVITDANANIQYVNPAFAALTGYSAEEAVGRNPRFLKSGSQDSGYYKELWETILAGNVWRGRLINRRKDGSDYREEMTITPVRDARGEITNYIALKQDVTETSAAERSRQFLASIVQSSEDAIIGRTLDGRIVTWNVGAEAIFGYHGHEVVGKSISMLIAPGPGDGGQGDREALLDGKSVRFESVGLTKRGERIGVSLCLCPIKDDHGQVTAVSAIIRSLESRRRAERIDDLLAQSQERLTMMLRASGIGVWSWEIVADVVEADENCSVLFGLPLGQFPETAEGFAALLYPDDRGRVQQSVIATVERGAPYNTEFRVVWPDGTVRTLTVRGKVYSDQSEHPRRLVGVCWDVTERQQVGENLRLTNEKLTQSLRELERRKEQGAMLSRMNDLLHACPNSSEAYGIVAEFCSRLFPSYAGALYIFSASRNVLNTEATWNDPVISDAAFGPYDCWALRRGQLHFSEPGGLVTSCRHLQGVERGHACFPLMAQGTGMGIMCFQKNTRGEAPEQFLTIEDRQLARTVAENVAISLSNLSLKEALRIQSIRDPLTSLFNRRYLEESVEQEIHRLTRVQRPAGFAMMDLDHFKTFNDTFGHEAGDAVLRAFGQFLRENIRKQDIACRYGGEEFCILFGESSLDDTVRRTEDLRSGVSRIAVKHGGQYLGSVTISIGVASYPTHGTSLNELVGAADKALYQAKKEGRNRVIAATTDPTPSIP